MAAFKGLPGAAAYCASKSAVNAYLESLRIELRAKRIAVTTVCPGFVNTPIIARNPSTMFLMEPDAAARPARVDRAWLMQQAQTDASRALAKELRRRGWTYVGPTTVYAFMQAMGLVNDHLDGCVIRPLAEAAR